jgi:hypothetical protein
VIPVVLSIAGIRIRISGTSQPLLDELAVRYRGFTAREPAGDDPPPYVVQVDIETGAVPNTLISPPAGFSGDRITFDLPGYRGEIDPEGSAEIVIASNTPGNTFDYFLRVVVSALAYQEGGMMLHAAGVVRNRRAYIFFGRSGSGKTTAARNAAGNLVLNDDLVVLLPQASRWIVHSTPFTNPTQNAPNAGAAPSAALLRLVKGPDVVLEPLTGAIAVAELVACVPVLNGSPSPPLERCRLLLQSVPAFDLHLRPDPSFWEAIDRIGA